MRACLKSLNTPSAPAFFRHALSLFLGIHKVCQRQSAFAWQKNSGASSILRDFKQALKSPLRHDRTVILSQSEDWRENPPDFQSAKLPVYNHASTDKKRKIQNPLVGRGIPDAPPCAEMTTRVTVNVQSIRINRREAACLLPAAGAEKLQSSNANTGKVTDLPKKYEFFRCFRRKEQSPFPTVTLENFRIIQHCTSSKAPTGQHAMDAAPYERKSDLRF